MFMCTIFNSPCDLDLVRLYLITLPSLGTAIAHAPCHVTYDRGP